MERYKPIRREKLDGQINIRCTSTERDYWIRCCKEEGITLAEITRYCLNAYFQAKQP